MLSIVGFRHLKINMGGASYARVRSQWMSENHEDLAPSSLVNGGFDFEPTQPTPVGLHYLQIQVTLDVALDAFHADAIGWLDHPSTRRMAPQRATPRGGAGEQSPGAGGQPVAGIGAAAL